MFVVKLDIFCWVAVLMCAGAPLSAAPTSPGRRGVVTSDMQPPPTADSPDGLTRWERGPSVSRSWRSRTPAEYQDRARREPTVRQQITASQSGGGHPRVIGGSQTSNEQPGIKTRSRGKAFVSGVRVAADRWRDGYDVVKSRPPSVVRDRTYGATRRPEETVQTRSSPKLSYIQRRRPLGSVATAGRLGSKGTQSPYRPAAPPSQPMLPYVLRPKTTTRPSRPVAIVTIAPPALPPRAGATPLAESNTFMGKPLITRRPTEHTVLKNGQASTNSKNHLSVINAAGLVPGSIVTKRLSVGLNVPHNGNHPASGVRITHRPQHSTKAPETSHSSTSTIRRKIPHTTKSPSLAPQKTSITVDTSGSTPTLEVLNLYEVGVLPNPSEFFNRQNTSALTSPSDGGTNGRGVSGGGSSKGSTKVTFPLHVLPAIPGAPPAPDWPMVPAGPVRPCCKGRPGLVIPVDPPDRPVYPSIGSGHKPLPPQRPPTAGHRPVSPPSTSYGPPTRPTGQLTPPGLTPPSRPTRRPCGTGHCVLVPPPPSAPPPTRPPAPPTTGVGTSLGNIGNDLVCVYLRSNGSALVLRADLNTGRYNISDDQNHLLSSPGWLDSNQPQVRDRPSHQHRYDVVYLDNQTATVQQLLTRMRNRTERWEEMHRPQTNIICIVRRPEAVPGNATSSQTPGGPAFKPTESPKPSEEPITPSAIPTPTAEATSTSESTTTPKPTILGAVDSLSSTIASAVDALGATAETQLATTMSAADQTAVVIGSNVKNYIGTSIPSIALATTVGIPVFVAMLALLGAPPLLLSALSVSSPLLLQGVAAFYNSLPN